jgi:muramoyltetrapeptide carboxypeptidase
MKKIQIISPSKCIDPDLIDTACDVLVDRNYSVMISANAKGSENYFSGSLEERIMDFQTAIDSNFDVIWCSRGGYGLIQYIDQINFSNQLSNPGKLIGFSDVTVAHLAMNKLGLETIHGTVPLNFSNVSEESLTSVFNAIEGIKNTYEFSYVVGNTEGEIEGEIVGGNLAIIYSLLGSSYLPDFADKILFIEDVGEAFYAIDRMMNALRLAGILEKISGLIVGGFTAVGDSNPAYGKSVEEIISTYVKHRNIPVCFNFPAGHIEDNRAIILGRKAKLSVREEGVVFIQE